MSSIVVIATVTQHCGFFSAFVILITQGRIGAVLTSHGFHIDRINYHESAHNGAVDADCRTASLACKAGMLLYRPLGERMHHVVAYRNNLDLKNFFAEVQALLRTHAIC